MYEKLEKMTSYFIPLCILDLVPENNGVATNNNVQRSEHGKPVKCKKYNNVWLRDDKKLLHKNT